MSLSTLGGGAPGSCGPSGPMSVKSPLESATPFPMVTGPFVNPLYVANWPKSPLGLLTVIDRPDGLRPLANVLLLLVTVVETAPEAFMAPAKTMAHPKKNTCEEKWSAFNSRLLII